MQQNDSSTIAPVRSFWILDGDTKTFVMRSEIKDIGGYWDLNHKAWCIDDPGESIIQAIWNLGMKIQFRRFKKIKD